MPKRPKLTQTASGKAWEYGLARALADILNVPLDDNNLCKRGQNAHDSLPADERRKIMVAAREAGEFLRAHDDRLDKSRNISMQSDSRGVVGDVRDIIVSTEAGEVGLSAKHRHTALKSPRLSERIDWPRKWLGESVTATPDYWAEIRPLFSELKSLKAAGVNRWPDIPDKETRFYVPCLKAFIAELNRHHERVGEATAREFMRYMIGRYDFYKVMKQNGHVLIQSFNIPDPLKSGKRGGFKWGKHVNLPSEIIRVQLEPDKKTTAGIIFNCGWALSMRIHSAESRLTPSLKFDVDLIGQPTTLANHIINYRPR